LHPYATQNLATVAIAYVGHVLRRVIEQPLATNFSTHPVQQMSLEKTLES